MSDLRIGGVPIAKLKVAELKAELEARELSKTGKKDELVARLISFMEVTTGISSRVDANDLFRWISFRRYKDDGGGARVVQRRDFLNEAATIVLRDHGHDAF